MTSTSDDFDVARLSAVLSDFARTMLSDFPIQAILDHLVAKIVEILPISSAGVILISAGEGAHQMAASNDHALAYENLQTAEHQGPCMLAFESNQSVLIADLSTEARFASFTTQALDGGMRAVFAFPLRHDSHRLGALDLYRDSAGPLSPAVEAAAQTFADVVAAYLINAQARSDLQASSDRSREQSLHDGLTGLPNRRLMMERLEHAFRRSRRTGSVSAVLFVDLDGFKRINDDHGHWVGDQLLVAVGERLSGLLRPPDTVARIHGDEFVILCEDLDAPEQAAGIVARLRLALSEPYVLKGLSLSISGSVGIAFADHEVHDPEQVLRDADTAMYRAKRRGGGRLNVFDPRYEHLAGSRDSLERDLKGALDRGELHNEYQSVAAVADGQIVGYEAFARWLHPVRGLVPPLTFIPIAEHAGVNNDVSDWLLRTALADAAQWQDGRSGDEPELSMAVNVSAHQLLSAGFVDRLDKALQHSGAEPGLLTIDVTETALARDSERASRVLGDARTLGVRVALDNFGTGPCSLGHLARFPLDKVKIDRSLIAGLERNETSPILVTAIVQLSHVLGLSVTAQGVESSRQHAQVAALGCDFSQGYFLSRPAPADAVRQLVQSGSGW